jgi:formylglycine-generating enzyme required for sulfatase activity
VRCLPLALLALLGTVLAAEPPAQPDDSADDRLLPDGQETLQKLHAASIDLGAKLVLSCSAGRLPTKLFIERLNAAHVEGVLLSHISIADDSEPSQFYPIRLGEKRFQLSISGTVSGKSAADIDKRLDTFRENLSNQFGVPRDCKEPPSELDRDGTPVKSSYPADFGFNRPLGARFDPPLLPRFVELPTKALNRSHVAGFTIQFGFELIPEVPATEPNLPDQNPLIAADAGAAYPLWNGEESVADYAARVSLPPAQSLNLGRGVKLQLVLIPAGEFTMGTVEPHEINRAALRTQIILAWAALAASLAFLFIVLSYIAVRALVRGHRINFSLARLLLMTVLAGIALLSGMHWWHSARMLENEQTELAADMQRKNAAYDNEMPAHKVTLTRPFYMGKFAVTAEQFQQVCGTNPSHFTGSGFPVDCVSWNDAQTFCQAVSKAAGRAVRLPTEAEWEFACRAGSGGAYYSGDEAADLDRAAWYADNSLYSTHPVGTKAPNKFGLYDMLGNVRQWCDDAWSVYPAHPVFDPHSPVENGDRVLRGGSWLSAQMRCRSAYRSSCNPIGRYTVNGFRIVLPAAKQ